MSASNGCPAAFRSQDGWHRSSYSPDPVGLLSRPALREGAPAPWQPARPPPPLLSAPMGSASGPQAVGCSLLQKPSLGRACPSWPSPPPSPGPRLPSLFSACSGVTASLATASWFPWPVPLPPHASGVIPGPHLSSAQRHVPVQGCEAICPLTTHLRPFLLLPPLSSRPVRPTCLFCFLSAVTVIGLRGQSRVPPAVTTHTACLMAAEFSSCATRRPLPMGDRAAGLAEGGRVLFAGASLYLISTLVTKNTLLLLFAPTNDTYAFQSLCKW